MTFKVTPFDDSVQCDLYPQNDAERSVLSILNKICYNFGVEIRAGEIQHATLSFQRKREGEGETQ